MIYSFGNRHSFVPQTILGVSRQEEVRWAYLVVGLDVPDDNIEVLHSQVDIIVDMFVHPLVCGARITKQKKTQEWNIYL